MQLACSCSTVMYSGALIGTRIQESGLSFLRPGITQPIAQWNIQTVRGKVTGRCLWHACKAFLVGICLLMVGSAMATIGYYADELAMEEHFQGNITINIKNTSRGYHLSNLSYVGPVIMGFGGFVMLAACVMTFEARDNSAKIVPARFQNKTVLNDGDSTNQNGQPSIQLEINEFWNRASTSSHAPSSDLSEVNRQTITHSFLQFSKYVQDSLDSGDFLAVPAPPNALLKRSPSAPTLTHLHKQALLGHSPCSSQRSDNRSLLGHPEVKRLQVNLLPRQALSVDNPRDGSHFKYSNFLSNMADVRPNATNSTDMDMDLGANASVHKTDSDGSMTMDLHLPDCSITLTVKDESKTGKHGMNENYRDPSNQSATAPQMNNANMAKAAEIGRRETSRRRPLLRQSQVELYDSDTESSPMDESMS